MAVDLYSSRPLAPREKPTDYEDSRLEGDKWLVDETHSPIWNWKSSDGKTVSFRRMVHNKDRRSAAMFSVWNESSAPTEVRGKIKAVCT